MPPRIPPTSGLPLLGTLALIAGTLAAADPVTTRAHDNLNDWGWPGHTLSNGLVTVGVVPAIGGRIMQYDLGKHAFLWVNPAELGKVHAPADDGQWRNFGGFKTWVAPQHAWRRGMGNWPPPPTLDRGAWTIQSGPADDASAVLTLESPIETFDGWQAKGLKMARRCTLTRGSTRLRVEQAVTNGSDHPQVVSLWDVTQMAACHPGVDDPDQFWVYFPKHPRSAYGPRGFMSYATDPGSIPGLSQYHELLGDGLVGVQYLRRGGKLGADSQAGWIAAVDERDGFTYVKRFAVKADAAYPEGPNTVAVYTHPDPAAPYVEVEVMSPLAELDPGKGFAFTIDWYATRIDGPILAVTDVAAVKQRLAVVVKDRRHRVSGTLGVFVEGTAALVGLPRKADGKRLALASYYCSPLQPLLIDADLTIPPEIGTLAVEIADGDGRVVGIADQVELPAATKP